MGLWAMSLAGALLSTTAYAADASEDLGPPAKNGEDTASLEQRLRAVEEAIRDRNVVVHQYTVVIVPPEVEGENPVTIVTSGPPNLPAALAALSSPASPDAVATATAAANAAANAAVNAPSASAAMPAPPPASTLAVRDPDASSAPLSIALAAGSPVFTSIEVVCELPDGGKYRRRAPFNGGTARLEDVPTEECKLHFKGGPPTRLAVSGGRSLKCAFVGGAPYCK